MPSSCKFGFLPIQVALVLDDLPGQLRVSFKYYTFLFPFSRILYSTYVDKVWIFPFLPRFARCCSGFSLACIGSLPCNFEWCFSFNFDFFFQGVEPVDHGPGPYRQQGPETRVCSQVLVPSLLWDSWKPSCPNIRTRVIGMCGSWRYLKSPSLYFLCSIVCSGTRMREGIRTFMDECAAAGRSEKSTHFLYVNGLDSKRCKIPAKDHLKRGACLSRLVDMWLDTWGEETENWDLVHSTLCIVISKYQDLLSFAATAAMSCPLFLQIDCGAWVCWPGTFLSFPYQVFIGQGLLGISIVFLVSFFF